MKPYIYAGVLAALLAFGIWYTRTQHAAGAAECDAANSKKQLTELTLALEKNQQLQAQVNRLATELLDARTDPRFTTVTKTVYEKIPVITQCNYQPDTVGMLNTLVSRAEHIRRARAAKPAD